MQFREYLNEGKDLTIDLKVDDSDYFRDNDAPGLSKKYKVKFGLSTQKGSGSEKIKVIGSKKNLIAMLKGDFFDWEDEQIEEII